MPYLGHIQLYLAHAWWTYGTALVQFWQRRCGPYLGRQTQTYLGHSSAVYLAHIFAKGNLLTGNTHPYGRGHHGFRHNFYFDESFFHFPFNNKGGRDFANSKYTLHFSQYVNEVVPDSFKRPYLIKITSDWCFSCIHIEPVWKETVQELETLGK